MKKSLTVSTTSMALALLLHPGIVYASEAPASGIMSVASVEVSQAMLYGSPPVLRSQNEQEGDDGNGDDGEQARQPMVDLPNTSDIAFAAISLGITAGGVFRARRMRKCEPAMQEDDESQGES